MMLSAACASSLLPNPGTAAEGRSASVTPSFGPHLARTFPFLPICTNASSHPSSSISGTMLRLECATRMCLAPTVPTSANPNP